MSIEVLWADQFWELQRDPETRSLFLLTPPGTDASRLRRAAAALAAAPTAGVLRVREIVEAGGRAAFRLDDPGGPTLAGVLRLGALEPRDASLLLVQLARTLATLHEHGMVHRWLRPELILVHDGSAHLIPGEGVKLAGDAGITRRGMYVPLPPPFAAPELLRDGEASAATDAWALGILTFAVLTGAPPVVSSDAFEFEALVRAGLPQLGDAIPAPLRDAYRGLTEASPERRWTVDQATRAFALASDREAGAQSRSVLRIRIGKDVVEVPVPCLIGRADPTIDYRPELDLTSVDPGLTVSRRHARIWRDADDIRIEDLGSRNGMTVNGVPVRTAIMVPGTVLGFGSATIELLE